MSELKLTRKMFRDSYQRTMRNSRSRTNSSEKRQDTKTEIASSSVTQSKLRKRNEERSQDSSDASVREVKKIRKLNPLPKKSDRNSKAKYDENGIDKETGLDLCDCLTDNCPGCWMDCPNCGSRKCGHECRRNRRYKYSYVDIEGTDVTIENKY